MIAISPYQLFSLMVLFQIGTTIIFGFASGAGRDAWISASASSLIGSALVAGYAAITKLNGYVSLVGCLRKRLGKWAGTPLAWLYVLVFIYEAARGVSDLKFLVPLTILPETPAWFFTAAFLMLVVYTARAGLEVLCRIAGVLLPVLIAFIILETLLLVVSGSLRFEYLTPFFSEGYQRVAKSIWPTGIMQSYGESIEMTVFWFVLNKRGILGRISVGATLFAGFFIVLFDVLSITTLGEHIFQGRIIPAFIVMRLVSVVDFLENLEAVGSLYFICTIFVKITVHTLAAALCMRELTYASKNNAAIWITACFTYVIGLTMASNFSEHLKAGIEITPKTILVPICLVLPGIVLSLSLFEKAKDKRAAR
ncbi:GerAB/ArcD/ProY family transporter [Paenibacillus alginolyticus]|uniref:Spore germination protein n=1 Tax=Paenibacillus alginolyticus TaxID=59839 RepID=A0ABT4GCC9_9BACL|nr:endospore germination permease [Paenibacillus alginolyticus]MCY9693833.1 spore germination protein [Paenibacillus alginolyticus]MEC0148168.1 endospore germination permease [Paenibacillus alginolyticus]